ncbi:MAG: hypothetical protein MHMPM18_000864 [Marteilia pararefringens]
MSGRPRRRNRNQSRGRTNIKDDDETKKLTTPHDVCTESSPQDSSRNKPLISNRQASEDCCSKCCYKFSFIVSLLVLGLSVTKIYISIHNNFLLLGTLWSICALFSITITIDSCKAHINSCRERLEGTRTIASMKWDIIVGSLIALSANLLMVISTGVVIDLEDYRSIRVVFILQLSFVILIMLFFGSLMFLFTLRNMDHTIEMIRSLYEEGDMSPWMYNWCVTGMNFARNVFE